MSATARLMAAIGLDTSQFNRGIDGAKQKAAEFGASFKNVGSTIAGAVGLGAGIATLVSFGRKATESAFQIERMAKITGLSAEQFQVLSDAVEDSGGNSEMLAQAMARVKDAQGNVISGNAAIIASLAKAGISARDFANAGAAEALMMIARAGEQAAWQGEAFSGVADILGMRSLPQLQIALDSLAKDGWGKMTQAMRESGELMDEITVKSLAEAKREWKLWGDVATAQTGKVAAGMRIVFSGRGESPITKVIRAVFGLKESGAASDVPDITSEDAQRMARRAGEAQRNRPDIEIKKTPAELKAEADRQSALQAEKEKRADLQRTDEERLVVIAYRKQGLTDELALEKLLTEELQIQMRLDKEYAAQERDRISKERRIQKDVREELLRTIEDERTAVAEKERSKAQGSLDFFEEEKRIAQSMQSFFAGRTPEIERMGGSIGANRQPSQYAQTANRLTKIQSQIDLITGYLRTIAGG